MGRQCAVPDVGLWEVGSDSNHLAASGAGAEVGQRIAIAVAILGGLVSSMALNLLVLRTLALRYGRFEPLRDELHAEPVPAESAADD